LGGAVLDKQRRPGGGRTNYGYLSGLILRVTFSSAFVTVALLVVFVIEDTPIHRAGSTNQLSMFVIQYTLDVPFTGIVIE
jgi:hypothetical protein